MAMIQSSTSADTGALTRIQVDSYCTTYRGIVPDSVLNNLSVERSRQNWEAIFEQEDTTRCLFAAPENDEIVGFTCSGEQAHTGDCQPLTQCDSN